MRLLAPALLLAALALTAGSAPSPSPPSPAAPDTLRFELTAGEPLVLELPGSEEAEFRGLRLPALSWLVGRSLMWRTVPGGVGREFLLIERRSGSRRDTLVLAVDVR